MRWWLIGFVGLAIVGTVAAWAGPKLIGRLAPIKVGLLHSRTGPMKISEESMVEAELLAIEEINAQGGLLGGRPIEPVIADGRSDWPTFQREAERLITSDRVSVIFGCWTSASRKSVKPVVEEHHHLLFYPMAYEGLEESPNIIYTGAAPNQQVIPAVKWSYDHMKARRYFLAGSDYVWPHAVNAIARDYLGSLGATVAGEEYVLYGSTQVDDLIAAIKRARPDVVISTVAGDTNLAFYRKLAEAGIGPREVPVISFSIAEAELRHMPARDLVGDYAAWNYFQSLDSEANHEFVRKFKARWGSDRVTSDVMVAAYNSVWLWAQAVAEADTTEIAAVHKAVVRQSLSAPEGIISVDATTEHTWRPVYIGRIRGDGQFDIVWTSDKAVRPVPFPPTRPRSQWESFLEELYQAWGGWGNTGATTTRARSGSGPPVKRAPPGTRPAPAAKPGSASARKKPAPASPATTTTTPGKTAAWRRSTGVRAGTGAGVAIRRAVPSPR